MEGGGESQVVTYASSLSHREMSGRTRDGVRDERAEPKGSGHADATWVTVAGSQQPKPRGKWRRRRYKRK